MTGWDGFAKYVGVQGILALMFGGAIVYLMVTSQPISEPVIGVFGLIVGFYFGKNGREIVATVKSGGAPAEDS